MKTDLVCQLNFGHKIWGAVSVIITPPKASTSESFNIYHELLGKEYSWSR